MSECVLWNGTRAGRYGTTRINGRRIYAHRQAWEDANGPIPPGMLVCHRCDEPLCVNPDHLFIGTQSDNMRDARDKGRLNPLPGQRAATKAARSSKSRAKRSRTIINVWAGLDTETRRERALKGWRTRRN